MTRAVGKIGCIFTAAALVLCSASGLARCEDESPMESMTVEEMRTYQAYYFASGGRDPMTMRYPTNVELGLVDSEKKTAPTIEQMETQLTQWVEAMGSAIKQLDYVSAIKTGDDAIYVIDNEWPELKADPPHLRLMNEEIRNLHRMATRLKAREDIKAEFKSLALRVEGVIWSPTDAKAVVNGRLLSAGEVMVNERKQGDLRIEIIEEFGVVFQFKGMRFRIPVEMYAPLAGL